MIAYLVFVGIVADWLVSYNTILDDESIGTQRKSKEKQFRLFFSIFWVVFFFTTWIFAA